MTEVSSLLHHIDPAALAYEDWLAVGMALHHEGATAEEWDAWSARDTARYRAGECARKWTGFNGSTSPVTGGTLVELAKRAGWTPPVHDKGTPLDWDDVIEHPREDYQIIDPDWVEDAELAVPDDWKPGEELGTYLSALFEAHEFVGYVIDSYVTEDGRHVPRKGVYSRTAGELLQDIARYHGDLSKVLGDCDPAVGAWIRFNPLDGQGVRDENVTAFRFALIESDTLSIEKQAAIYAEMELPVAILVHSGKKSLHAIVRIGATSKEEYRERVQFLHKVCKKNGLEVDGANKNPSRLSRLPGVLRNGQKQYIVGVNQGKANWEEWKTYVEEANDNLPDFENLADVFFNLPPLAPTLIEGVLRQGHKLLLSGPSKAGKSFLLLQLAIAIAEGGEWLGWPCRQGRVLYVNLEVHRPSCFHRLPAIYCALGLSPSNVKNIDVWNLRGSAIPLDMLAPKLIRRARKHNYAAVFIDPIYKVITGDENAADKMAFFCNQFDKLCAELTSAVIYCHHHSKGQQGQKSSRDRASGSGVFARDPDAILDIIELHLPPKLRAAVVNRGICDALAALLDREAPDWRVEIAQDDWVVADKLLPEASRVVGRDLAPEASVARALGLTKSAWRLEATLREFAPFEPRRFWFAHPIHKPDTEGLLVDAKADGEEAPWIAEKKERAAFNQEHRETDKDRMLRVWNELNFEGEPPLIGDIAASMGETEQRVKSILHKTRELVLCDDHAIRDKASANRYELDKVISACTDLSGACAVADVAKAMQCSDKTMRRKIAEHGSLDIKQGKIIRKEESQ